MKKILFTFILILSLTQSFSQYKIAKTNFSYLVTESSDSIYVRILPNKITDLNILIKNNSNIQLKNANNSLIAEINRNSIEEKIKNPEIWEEKSIGIIESVIHSKQEMEKNFTFALFIIGLGYNKDLSNLSNTLYAFPKSNSDRYVLTFKVGNVEDMIEFNSSEIKDFDLNVDLFGEAYFQNCVINWDALKYQGKYSGHMIQKSYDSIHFKNMNEVPYVHLISQDEKKDKLAYFQDTTQEKNGSTVYFRIISLDYFTKYRDTSNVVSIYFNKKINGDLFIDTIYSDNYDRIIKTKIYPREENFDNSIKEYILYQSDSILGPYQFIESKKSNSLEMSLSFTEKITSGDKNFFKVAAVSVDNDTIYSPPRYYFTFDQIPPHQPTGLEGIIDTLGVVNLKWGNNKDNDLQGYRLFTANHIEEEFVELTENFIFQPNYRDSIPLLNLTKERYYFVIATDLNYNNSISSDTILIIKPDFIPPVTCLLSKFELKENGVEVFWNNSTSDDVFQNFLIRYHHNSNRIDTVLIWSDTTNIFFDTDAKIGEKYQYYIKTTDESKNASFSEKLPVSYELGYRPAPQNLKGKVDREGKLILLEWENPSYEIYAIQIYRKKENGIYSLEKTIFEDTNEFSDKNISPNQNYTYKIKIQTTSGHHSLFSNEIIIEF